MSSQINLTLLEKLFTNPNPLDRKKRIFFSLHKRMFPCDKVFKDFLLTGEMNERVSSAEYIVRQLCFESNFPPPVYLLDNLLDYENSDLNKSSNESYFPQDHLVHIVFTYLLGLYIFYYSPLINKELTHEFLRTRTEGSNDPALDATKDFISYWKYFCLYHDIAYPIESAYLKGENNFTLKDEGYWKYIDCFNKLEIILSREILLKGISKYLVVRQLLNDNSNSLFSDVLSTVRCSVRQISGKENKDIDIEEIKNNYGEYKSIDKIHCNEHIKMLTGFVSRESYITVLFDAYSEQPIAIKSVKNAESSKNMYYILNIQYMHVQEKQIMACIEHEDYMLDERFFVRYYFKDIDNEFNKYKIKFSTGDDVKEQHYKKIIELLNRHTFFSKTHPEPIQRFEQIHTSYDLNTYIFQLNRALTSYVNEIFEPEKAIPSKIATINGEHNKIIMWGYLKKNFKKIFQETVLKEMDFPEYEDLEGLKSDNISLLTLNREEINEVVKVAVFDMLKKEKIDEYKLKIVEKFTESIEHDLKNEVDIHGLTVNYIFQCNKEFLGKQTLIDWSIFGMSEINLEYITKTANELKEYIHRLGKYIYSKLGIEYIEDSFSQYEEFIKKYRTQHYECDHGIYAANIFLMCFNIYRKRISSLFSNNDDSTGKEDNSFKKLMSTLCWNVENNKYENKLIKDYEHIVDADFRSIFLHNLYPNEVRNSYDAPKSSWEYDFIQEPSVYFGMLVDALQVWNRNKYYEHSKIKWWPMFSMDCYDIAIDGNKIILKVKDYNNDIQKIKKKFIDDIDGYLKNYSSMVSIDIIH